MRVAIAGAGAGGLSVAWSLARAGVETHVFDAGAAGSGATWASAGMLTPWQYERPDPLQRACAEAALLWPSYRDTLEAASGLDLGFRWGGAIRIAATEIEAQALRGRVARLSPLGARAVDLAPLPPFLTHSVRLALNFEGEGVVDNRALGRALPIAIRAAGGHVHEGERIIRVLMDGDKVLGVETPARRLSCDVVVIAAGAWSGDIAGMPPDVRPPVVPRKGQIIAVDALGRCALGGPLCSAQGFYAVPKANGQVMVGATLEDAGFSAQTDQDSVRTLRQWLCDTIIRADEWPVVEAWAGLRPGTPDDLPILGPARATGLHFATGQFRDGILLTPWIADWVSMAIMSGATSDRLAPFSISRFRKDSGS